MLESCPQRGAIQRAWMGALISPEPQDRVAGANWHLWLPPNWRWHNFKTIGGPYRDGMRRSDVIKGPKRDSSCHFSFQVVE